MERRDDIITEIIENIDYFDMIELLKSEEVYKPTDPHDILDRHLRDISDCDLIQTLEFYCCDYGEFLARTSNEI